MSRNILLVMSLSGTVIMFFYFLTYPVAKRYFPLAWRYWILKIAILFFLIPFPYFKYYILDIIYDISPALWASVHRVPEALDPTYLVIDGPSGDRWYSPGLKKLFVLLFILGILAAVIVFTQFLRYWKMRRICVRYSSSCVDDQLQKYISENQNQLNLRRKVQVLCSEYCSIPMTMGVWSPVVFCPKRKIKQKRIPDTSISSGMNWFMSNIMTFWSVFWGCWFCRFTGLILLPIFCISLFRI